MQKYVTRTQLSYRHTFGKMVKEEDGFKVTETFSEVFDTKLGERKVKEYLKKKQLTGYTLLGIEEIKEKFACPMEIFMANAVKVEE